MKRYLVCFIAIFALLLLPKSVDAAGIGGVCDYKVLSDYRSLASNVNITYSYKLEEGKPIFDITISNIYENMYIIDSVTNKTYRSEDFTADNEITLTGYYDDQKIRFDIYASGDGCYGMSLMPLYATLPNYNEFSSDKVCIGAEEYSLCQRWGAVSEDYDSFVAKVTAYKERKKAKAEAIKFDNKQTLLEKIFAFVGEYYAILVCIVIVAILIIGALHKTFLKKKQFDFKV